MRGLSDQTMPLITLWSAVRSLIAAIRSAAAKSAVAFASGPLSKLIPESLDLARLRAARGGRASERPPFSLWVLFLPICSGST
jgi:hypothetical protein